MFDYRLFAFPTRPVCFRPHKISRKSLFQNTLHISPTRSILYTENIANLNKLRISGGRGYAAHSTFGCPRFAPRLSALTWVSALAPEFASTVLRPIRLRVCTQLWRHS